MQQASTQPVDSCFGLDLGDLSSNHCLVDGQGQIVREGTVETTREALMQLFSAVPRSRVVMEATRNTHWVRQVLKAAGHEVIVANPRQLHLISKSLRKTDRNDARILARVGRLDLELLRPVHERSDLSMQVRLVMRSRTSLVRMRTKLINLVRGSVKVFGYRMPTCTAEHFHIKARLAMPAELRETLTPLLDTLEGFGEKIKAYDRQIAQLCEQFPQTKVFQQVRGVGPLVSLTFLMCVEDPRRFKDSRSVGVYIGLTPGSRQSGNSDPRMRITKQGDGELRALLVTAATHIMRRSAPDTDLKRYGRRIAQSGTPRDRGRAKIAVARKLAVLLHRLWLTGEVYEPLRSTAAAA